MKLIELHALHVRAPRTVTQTHRFQKPTGEMITRKQEFQTSQDEAETRQLLIEAAQSFIETIEFYKKDFGDPKSHDEAVKETLQIYESRRQYVEGLQPQEITWGDFAAVAEVNTDDVLRLWERIRKTADDELECKRGARVAGLRS